MDFTAPLVTVQEVLVNATHLKAVSEADLEMIIQDVHMFYIYKYYRRWYNREDRVYSLKYLEKLLVQFTSTLNIRRADSESIPGMSKSLSVPKDLGLDQNEYGQMAKKLGKTLGLDWATDDDEPACLRIY